MVWTEPWMVRVYDTARPPVAALFVDVNPIKRRPGQRSTLQIPVPADVAPIVAIRTVRGITRPPRVASLPRITTKAPDWSPVRTRTS
ncbi:predicted protein [Chaetomium globosum CBS 148.51]|uniref:Uncharacterized protein n=1 Tax=Chaetomium globosum (strain ATCC 6205 / CBS 148.51 / DSM 1962 / NBRC 6347 / NRRL 1970) TaxID=306901 RepID=Q2HEU9_CHAGB|nr:uncharacterized protein CHGG_01255 [Chaetomium globosum CBS 148.51]EAQ93020.1 predicted protein [Chaetomium globosum CBS 148.51]